MSELNFGLKISTFRINININIDEKSNKDTLSNAYMNELKLKEADNIKEKLVVDYHLASCHF